MIDRLNFFDLYGYLIPGLVLTIVVALPYAVADPTLFKLDLGSGLLLIVVAYVVGQQMIGLAELALPSKMMVNGELRHYSSFILEEHDPTRSFAARRRTEVRDRIASYFGDTSSADPALRFFECRTVLLHRKLAAYPEQFQGMYICARGIALACAFGACHLLGWLTWSRIPTLRLPNLHGWLWAGTLLWAVAAAGSLVRSRRRLDQGMPLFLQRALAVRTPVLRAPIVGLAIVGNQFRGAWHYARGAWGHPPAGPSSASETPAPEAQRKEAEKRAREDGEVLERMTAQHLVAALGVLLVLAGRQAADSNVVLERWGLLLAAVLVSGLLALRSYAVFHHFAREFAIAVYRDFAVMVDEDRREQARKPKKDVD